MADWPIHSTLVTLHKLSLTALSLIKDKLLITKPMQHGISASAKVTVIKESEMGGSHVLFTVSLVPEYILTVWLLQR